jgi:hypothetical protein
VTAAGHWQHMGPGACGGAMRIKQKNTYSEKQILDLITAASDYGRQASDYSRSC